jgi:hypothetical protein
VWASILGGMILPKLATKLKLPTCTSIFMHMGEYIEKLKNGFLEISSNYRTRKRFSKFKIGWEDMGGSITRICPNCNKAQIFEDFI